MHRIELTKPIIKINKEEVSEPTVKEKIVEKETDKEYDFKEQLLIVKDLFHDLLNPSTDPSVELLEHKVDMIEKRLIVVETLLNYFKTKI